MKTSLVKSKKDNKLYVGFAKRIDRRIREHNSGKVEATRSRKPFVLIYYEACLSKAKTIKREKYFKSGFGRRFLNSRI